jgi:CHASE2 domain-containing sensor protein
MPPRNVQVCPRRGETDSLIRDQLRDEQLTSAQQHLLECDSCRSAFRQHTARRFPRLKNYTIVSVLGRGGFGVVYKALHHSKQRFEAIKVLFGKTAQRTAYFENEVRLVARLRHPNIATLYEAHLTSSPLYYSMEYVQGQHLDAYFTDHEVSLEERINLFKTVAQAMGYAHQQGVIHRDLKPQNILIDPQGQPRIVDFGIARKLVVAEDGPDPPNESGPAREGVLGTYGYIAPEQIAGADVDSRADIYGLGALLFHMLTGQPARFAPQVARLTEVLLERHVSRAHDLASIIACCVHPEPGQRYQDSAELVQDLEDYLAGRPIRARRDPSPGYRAARIATLVLRNHPRSVQALALAAVTVILAWTFHLAGASQLAPARGKTETALVALMPSTLEAIRSGRIGADLPGLDPQDKMSWRLLYGQLLARLSRSRPLVVVWDYYFPTCQPEYDQTFVNGIRSLPAPVIVGCRQFDLNGEPELCPDIRSAVDGWGILMGSRPDASRGSVYIPLAVQRGNNPPVPALALAAAAAARYPQHAPDLAIDHDRLELRYRKRRISAGERRWHEDTHTLRIFKTEEAGLQTLPFTLSGQIEPGDRCHFGAFPFAQVPDWAARPIPLEEVLTADPQQCQRWFDGRAVLIGQMIPPFDMYSAGSQGPVYGCQIQASVLNDLMTGTMLQRLSQRWLALRFGLWCALAALIADLLPIGRRLPLRTAAVVTVVVMAASVVAGVALAVRLTAPWAVELCVAVCGLVAGGAAGLLVNLVHRRQLHLTPGPVWSAPGTTLSTTVLATGGGSTPSRNPVPR